MHAICKDDLFTMKYILAKSPESIEYCHQISGDVVDAGDDDDCCKLHPALESLPLIHTTAIIPSTPLHLAACIGSTEICSHLISYTKDNTRYGLSFEL